MTTITDLASLLAPVTIDEFVADYRGQRWLHIPGAPEKAGAMLDWAELDRILAMEVWNHQNLLLVLDTQSIPAQAYCRQRVDRTNQPQACPVPSLVQQHLDRGASLVLNEVETLLPGCAGVIRAFEQGMRAKCSGNAYISQQNHQAFDSHFDRTDVFAIQTLGEKRWRIYEGQMEAPVAHAKFGGMPKAEIHHRKGKVEAEIVTKPGDVLYLPRGRFHDALATEGPSIHLSFAVSEPKGLDLLQIVLDEAVDVPDFRRDLPFASEDLPAHLEMLADRLREVARGERTLQRAQNLRRQYSHQRPAYSIGRRGE